MEDIEIYIREPLQKKVLGWIRSRLGPLQETGTVKRRTYRAIEHDPIIDIQIQTAVGGSPYTCIWFKSAHTPWQSDVECAREAYAALGLPVQCDPGPEHSHPDDFFRIDAQGERMVRLRGGQLGTE